MIAITTILRTQPPTFGSMQVSAHLDAYRDARQQYALVPAGDTSIVHRVDTDPREGASYLGTLVGGAAFSVIVGVGA